MPKKPAWVQKRRFQYHHVFLSVGTTDDTTWVVAESADDDFDGLLLGGQGETFLDAIHDLQARAAMSPRGERPIMKKFRRFLRNYLGH